MFTRLIIVVFCFCMISGYTQTAERVGSGRSPRDAVTLLWMMGTRGELLTAEGWEEASRSLFTKPVPQPGNKVILIRSNNWSLPSEKITGDTAEVRIGFGDAGQIDSALHYTPPRKSDMPKTVMFYRLIYVRTYRTRRTLYKDGKVEEKKLPGSMEWKIDGSPDQPWTTVNTAIRYVLEVREKTKDPVIKKNADQTLAKLLKLK